MRLIILAFITCLLLLGCEGEQKPVTSPTGGRDLDTLSWSLIDNGNLQEALDLINQYLLTDHVMPTRVDSMARGKILMRRAYICYKQHDFVCASDMYTSAQVSIKYMDSEKRARYLRWIGAAHLREADTLMAQGFAPAGIEAHRVASSAFIASLQIGMEDSHAEEVELTLGWMEEAADERKKRNVEITTLAAIADPRYPMPPQIATIVFAVGILVGGLGFIFFQRSYGRVIWTGNKE